MTNNTPHQLPIIVSDANYLVDARLLHKKLEVAEKFSQWFQRKVKEYGFTEGEDFFKEGFTEISEKPISKGGRPANEYLLTLDMAKELAMVQNNEVGRQTRRYFIAKEKELRTAPPAKHNHNIPYLDLRHLPYTYSAVNGFNIRTIAIEGILHYQLYSFAKAVGLADKNHKLVRKLSSVEPLTKMIWLFGMTQPGYFTTYRGVQLIQSSRNRNLPSQPLQLLA